MTKQLKKDREIAELAYAAATSDISRLLKKDKEILEKWEEYFSEHIRFAGHIDTKNFISALLAAQTRVTAQEERKRCVEAIDKYMQFAKKLHLGAHKDNQNMLLYDAHSRIVACEHLKEKLLSTEPSKNE